MIETTTPLLRRESRKRRSDLLARRLTATAGAAAFGLAGILVGLAAGAPRGAAAAVVDAPPPNADQALAKAVSDYEAALAAQTRPAAPAPSQLTAAPAPARVKATARPPAVVVSGGS
jgi:hypothetical protein